MRAKLTLLSVFVVGIVGGALVSACQTYDFEPVEPLALAQTTIATVIRAKASKPNLMVLLDTSGSMKLPVNPYNPDNSIKAECKAANGSPERPLCGDASNAPCNVNQCPTRWSELQAAMSTFLASSGTIARIGLTTYPATAGGDSCGASSAVRISIPQVDDADSTALQGAASQISTVIQGIPPDGTSGPSGGTPTSLSLKFVGSLPDLQTEDRADFILLLTDGLPNCNPQGHNPATCTCTQTSGCGTTASVCLDKVASVDAVKELVGKNIRTIVIGFGAETASGAGPDTLNAMAEAGDFPRNCASAPNDPNACGAGDTCDPVTQLCGRRFFQAANQAELSKALVDIINLVGKTDPCLLTLDATQRPTDDSLIVVYVNDQPVAGGSDTWSLNAQGVQFAGATCDRIKSSTDTNPIKLEVRAVQRK